MIIETWNIYYMTPKYNVFQYITLRYTMLLYCMVLQPSFADPLLMKWKPTSFHFSLHPNLKTASSKNQFPFSEDALKCSIGDPWKLIFLDILNTYTPQTLLPSELKPHNCNSERQVTQADLVSRSNKTYNLYEGLWALIIQLLLPGLEHTPVYSS